MQLSIKKTTVKGSLLGLALSVLAIAIPTNAFAHFHISSDNFAVDSPSKLDFQFTHGCDTDSTTALVMQMPKGISSFSVEGDDMWKAVDEKGSFDEVTLTAVKPIPTKTIGKFTATITATEKADTLEFPTIQECENGKTLEWTESQAEGAEEPEHPIPTFTVSGDAHDQMTEDMSSMDHDEMTSMDSTDHSSSDTASMDEMMKVHDDMMKTHAKMVKDHKVIVRAADKANKKGNVSLIVGALAFLIALIAYFKSGKGDKKE